MKYLKIIWLEVTIAKKNEIKKSFIKNEALKSSEDES